MIKFKDIDSYAGNLILFSMASLNISKYNIRKQFGPI